MYSSVHPGTPDQPSAYFFSKTEQVEDVTDLEDWGDHAVEKATNQTSKGWFIVAMVVGALMVVGAGFGTLGLLHTYGIALPQFLHPMASAIGSLGPEALWGLTAGGGAIGLGLIIWGAYKLYKDPTRFGDRFDEFGFFKPIHNIPAKNFYKVGYYDTVRYIKRCTPSGVLECTGPLTQEELDSVCLALNNDGYDRHFF